MHVVRDGAEVVEELAQHVPSAVGRHDAGPEKLVADRLDGFLEQDLFRLGAVAVRGDDVGESFVLGRSGAVVGVCRGGEPAFVDTAPMRTESVDVAGMQFQAAPGHQKRSGHPAGGETYDALTSAQGRT